MWKKGKRIKPTSNIETLIRWISQTSGPGGGPSIPVSGHRRISTVLTREKYERKNDACEGSGLDLRFFGIRFFCVIFDVGLFCFPVEEMEIFLYALVCIVCV